MMSFETREEVFIPDAFINLYPPARGKSAWWSLHVTEQIARDCEEPGALHIAVPVCLSKGKKPIPIPDDFIY